MLSASSGLERLRWTGYGEHHRRKKYANLRAHLASLRPPVELNVRIACISPVLWLRDPLVLPWTRASEHAWTGAEAEQPSRSTASHNYTVSHVSHHRFIFFVI